MLKSPILGFIRKNIGEWALGLILLLVLGAALGRLMRDGYVEMVYGESPSRIAINIQQCTEAGLAVGYETTSDGRIIRAYCKVKQGQSNDPPSK